MSGARDHKDRIVEAAAELIAWGGPRAASPKAVAKVAQTSLTQIYQRYEDRETLMVAVFQRGWMGIESAVARRAIGVGSPKALTLAIVEALADAYVAEPIMFSAALILGAETFGDPSREALKSSNGFSGYRAIAERLREQLLSAIDEDELDEVVEMLFGAVERRFLILTPLFSGHRGVHPSFDRQRLLRVFTRMLEGLLGQLSSARPVKEIRGLTDM